jgi:hypothetical protein
MSGMRDRLARIERGLEAPQVDVLELVNWVYSKQRAHEVAGRGGVRLGYGSVSADGIARIGELSRLGCRVDVSVGDGGELHPVAETLHYLAGQIQARHQAPAWLLWHYGAQNGFPPAYDLELELGPQWRGEPRYEASGRPKQGAFKVVHDGSSAKVALYCPLDFSHGAEYQAELRREYEHWHLALRCLVEACAKADLGRLVVTGPAISREPWIDRGELTLQREPSRKVENKPTRSAVQSRLLSILLNAVKANLVKDDDGQWRVFGADDGQAYGEELVNRLVKQGLAFTSADGPQGRMRLGVTLQGHEELRAAELVE